MPRNKDFGGVVVDFSDCSETMETVFGKDDISPGVLSQRLWAYVALKGIRRATRGKVALVGKERVPRPSVTPSDSIDDVTTYKRRARA